MEFRVGDKVKLRGGGRVMIVSLVVGDPPPGRGRVLAA